MNTSTLITQGATLEQVLASFREIVRDEIASIPTVNQNEKPYLTIQEAADLTGHAKQTLYRLTSEKEIPHLKRGGKILFKRSDLIAWVEACTVEINKA
jgi:excisionase family DNA binding protein